MAVKATLTVDYAAGADTRLVNRRLQTKVDSSVAPRTDAKVLDVAGTATVDFEDDVTDEQIIGAWKAWVNLVDLPGSGVDADTIGLTNVSTGSRSREFNV